jgi:hypothetical protein
MRSEDDVGSVALDGLDGLGSVEPIQNQQRLLFSTKRRIVRVIAQSDEPCRRIDQIEVSVVVERAIQTGRQLEHVQTQHVLDIRRLPRLCLEHGRRDVVARTDARG